MKWRFFKIFFYVKWNLSAWAQWVFTKGLATVTLALQKPKLGDMIEGYIMKNSSSWCISHAEWSMYKIKLISTI